MMSPRPKSLLIVSAILLFVSIVSLATPLSLIPAIKIPITLLDAKNEQFIAHTEPGRFGSYLAMTINYSITKGIFEQLESQVPSPLKNRGEAHITVITPLEYFDVLKEFVSIGEINVLAKNFRIQSSQFEVICLGNFGISNEEQTYYLVVHSEDLLQIRRRIHQVFRRRGGNPDAFDPDHFFPHITLGFIKDDLYESDGAIKDSTSCLFDTQLTP